jgi:hypothetical protein
MRPITPVTTETIRPRARAIHRVRPSTPCLLLLAAAACGPRGAPRSAPSPEAPPGAPTAAATAVAPERSQTPLTSARTLLPPAPRPLSASAAAAAAGIEDIVISAENIGSYDFGGSKHAIFASLRNEANPERPTLWQFRYVPLVEPHRGPGGEVAATPVSLGSRVRVVIPIALSNDVVQARALGAVRAAYPRDSAQIGPASVTPVAVRRIEFAWQDLGRLLPTARLVEPALDLTSQPADVSFVVELPTKADTTTLRFLLRTSKVQYTLFFASKEAKVNTVVVTWDDLRSSQLRATLDGTGTRKDYVHRDDVRDLVKDVTRVLASRVVLEMPERFERNLADQVLERIMPAQADVSQFTAEEFAATYHAADLRPDSLSHTLTKMFEKDSNTRQWKLKKSFDGSGKAGFLQVVSVEAQAKGNFEEEELKTFFRQHDIEVDIVGTQIVAKAVKVRRLNTSAFTGQGTFAGVEAWVVEGPGQHPGVVDLAAQHVGVGTTLAARLAELERTAASVTARVGQVQREAPPVGTVVASVLAPEEFFETVDRGAWAPAQGGAAPAGSRYRQVVGDTLPDLRGLFLRGLNTFTPGAPRTDGNQDPDQRAVLSIQGPAVQDHEHRLAHIEEIGFHLPDGASATRIDAEKGTPTKGRRWPTTTLCTSCGRETRPRNAAVYYYVRIN